MCEKSHEYIRGKKKKVPRIIVIKKMIENPTIILKGKKNCHGTRADRFSLHKKKINLSSRSSSFSFT